MAILNNKLNNKLQAQSIVEYAVLTGIVVAVMVGMNIYFKRGYQGYLKKSSDNIGPQFSASFSNYSETVVSKTKIREILTPQGVTGSESIGWGVRGSSGFSDDFSGRRLSNLSLFER